MIECKFCGKKNEELFRVDIGRGVDFYYCDDCFDVFEEKYKYCRCCANYVKKEDFRYGKKINSCLRCFNTYFLLCEKCGNEMEEVESFFFGNTMYCNDCFKEIIEKLSMKEVVELLIEMERDVVFPEEFLKRWVEMLREDVFTCPCQASKVCEIGIDECSRCERSTLFVEIKRRGYESAKDTMIAKSMLIKCLEGLILES